MLQEFNYIVLDTKDYKSNTITIAIHVGTYSLN